MEKERRVVVSILQKGNSPRDPLHNMNIVNTTELYT